MAYNFPVDFALGEKMRDQVIQEILFASEAPLSAHIFECIPKQLLSCQDREDCLENNRSWHMWAIGSLNASYEFRNIKNRNNGWGNRNTLKRSIIENQMYNLIRQQQVQIDELKVQIDELKNK